MTQTGATSVARGALLTVGMRWISRLVGVVSTLILARLLAPEDFGITAMATIVLNLVGVFLDLGINIALIQNRNATQDHYNTAWTLGILQAAGIAGIVMLASPLAGHYFGDPRVTPVMYVLAFNILIRSLENVGIITFQKNMQFAQDFRFLISVRLFTFVCTVASAFILRSYWALVLAGTLGSMFSVALSYVVHPMRPRLSMSKTNEIFAVSQWMLLKNIGNYLDSNLHKILVGRRDNTATMGAYSLASEVSAVPTSELLTPLNRVLFPAFVRAKDDPVELKRMFLVAQGVQTLIAMPASVGLAMMAQQLVPFCFGERWIFAVPLMQALALAGSIEAIATSPLYVMITLGKARWVAGIVWAQVIFFVACAFVVFPTVASQHIAMLRVATLAAGLMLTLAVLLRTLPVVRGADLARTLWRPALATSVLAAALWQSDTLPIHSVFALLVLKCAVCALVYPTALFGSWWLAGKPAGAEAYLLGKLSTFRKPS